MAGDGRRCWRSDGGRLRRAEPAGAPGAGQGQQMAVTAQPLRGAAPGRDAPADSAGPAAELRSSVANRGASRRASRTAVPLGAESRSCTQAVCKAMECGAPAVAPAAALRSALRSQPHRSAAAPRTAAAGEALRLDRLEGACLEGGHRHPGGNQEFLSAVLQSSCWERGTNLPSLECPPGCTT